MSEINKGHEVSIHDVEHIWRDLGFRDEDVTELNFTPYEVAITTLYRHPQVNPKYAGTVCIDGACCEQHSQTDDGWVCTEGHQMCHVGVATVTHHYRIVYPEQREHNEKLLKDMEADAEKFENVEIS